MIDFVYGDGRELVRIAKVTNSIPAHFSLLLESAARAAQAAAPRGGTDSDS